MHGKVDQQLSAHLDYIVVLRDLISFPVVMCKCRSTLNAIHEGRMTSEISFTLVSKWKDAIFITSLLLC